MKMSKLAAVAGMTMLLACMAVRRKTCVDLGGPPKKTHYKL